MSSSRMRDVDWPLVEGALARAPRVVQSEKSSFDELLLFSQRLSREASSLQLGFEFLAGLREIIGLDRVALFLRSRSGRWLSGLVGTSVTGGLVDERAIRHQVDPTCETLWSDLREGRRSFELLNDAPWIAHEGEETRVIGRGWFVRTPIVVDDESFGFLYNDSALAGEPFDREKQERAAVLLMLAGRRLREARDRSLPRVRAGMSLLVGLCVELLITSPAASNTELAQRLRVSPARLARTFEAETGISLIDYRNELRLERFFSLNESAEHDARAVTLVELALEAGFGSYSQFHRVFSARFGRSPRHFSGEDPRSVSLEPEP